MYLICYIFLITSIFAMIPIICCLRRKTQRQLQPVTSNTSSRPLVTTATTVKPKSIRPASSSTPRPSEVSPKLHLVAKEPPKKLAMPLNNEDDKDREPSAKREESAKEEKPKVDRTIIFTLDENPQQHHTQPEVTLKSTIDSFEKTTERNLRSSHLCSTQQSTHEREPELEPTQTSSIRSPCLDNNNMSKSDYQSLQTQKTSQSLQTQKASQSLQKTSSQRHDGKIPVKSEKSKPSVRSNYDNKVMIYFNV